MKFKVSGLFFSLVLFCVLGCQSVDHQGIEEISYLPKFEESSPRLMAEKSLPREKKTPSGSEKKDERYSLDRSRSGNREIDHQPEDFGGGKKDNKKGYVEISGMWIPALTISVDKDRSEPGGDLPFPGEVDTGEGFGLRLGFGGRPKKINTGIGILHASLGLLYMFTDHRRPSTNEDVDLHSLFAEVLFMGTSGSETVGITFGLAMGGGASTLEFEEADDKGMGAFEMRGLFGIHLFNIAELRGGGGFFVMGYPTETQIVGGFFTVEIRVGF